MRESASKLFNFSIKKKLFFLILNILLFLSGSAQPFFELKFGTLMDDRARAVQQLSDGSTYVAGFSNGGPFGGYDIALTKISPSGIIQWTKDYGKQDDEYALFMSKTSDNALILCGETHSTLTGVDAWIMKIDSGGDVMWGNGLISMLNESFKYVEETSDGGFILGGFQSDSSNSNDILIVKTDNLGYTIWQKTYGGTDNDYADAVKQTSDGGYLISADSRSFGLPDYDIYMLKIDSTGNFEWDNLSGGPYADGCQGFIITSDKGYFTFGESIVSLSLPYQYFLQLTDSMGNIMWEKTMGGMGADAAFSAMETNDGGFMITGYSNSNDINNPIDLVVFKVNDLGDSLWSRYYGGSGIDIGYHIIPCIGGGFLVAGTTWQNDNDFYLLKVNDDGIVSSHDIYLKEEQLKIYPNPSKDHINVHLPRQLKDPIVTVFSQKGKAILNEKFVGNHSELKLDHYLDSGNYIIQVKGENTGYSTVFLVE
ncbi:MAG: T9SS type A sorting domain-containing protein [Bacteroidia bacterium]